MARGKKFEGEVGRALLQVAKRHRPEGREDERDRTNPAIHFENSNSQHPFSDYHGVYRGMQFVLEAKETELDRLAWDRITDREKDILKGVSAAGGLALIVIKEKRARAGRPVLWAIVWADLQRARLAAYARSAGRSRARAGDGSLPLGPATAGLVEVPKVERSHGLESVWDLEPLFLVALEHQRRGLSPVRVDRLPETDTWRAA